MTHVTVKKKSKKEKKKKDFQRSSVTTKNRKADVLAVSEAYKAIF